MSNMSTRSLNDVSITSGSGVSESWRTEKKGGRSAFRQKGKACVGSLAQANIQHPRDKEAEKKEGHDGTRNQK